MSIAAQAALRDLRPVSAEADPQRIQRRLSKRLCARCGYPASQKKRRRYSPLCEACWEGYGWCSSGQHVAPRDQFPLTRTNPRGIAYECRTCRSRRRHRRPPPLCSKCQQQPVAANGRGRRKLCEGCLQRYAWCNKCGPRARRLFHQAIRQGKGHAGTCNRCSRIAPEENQLLAYQAKRAALRAAAIADAVARPLVPLAQIAAEHRMCTSTLSDAMAAAGVARGIKSSPRHAQRMQSAERWELARQLNAAALAEALGISIVAAHSLRARARKGASR